jgi:molybdopterin synthase catalytic subunit
MQVRVLFFGVLKDLAGRSSDVLSLPDSATAADVIHHYAQRLPKPGVLNSIAISVNQEYARPEDQLRAGDEIALLPPVSGGSVSQAPPYTSSTPRVFLTSEKIDTEAVVQGIKRPEDGAVVVFEGIVRNHSRGRPTLFLEYEAYPEMALKEMDSLIEQATRQFQIRDGIIVHRLGRLEIGETSVAIVVASAHRAAAFDACRWLIDSLKRTVPIWKKEHFEDGAVWSDGEPFPSAVTGKSIVGERPSPPVHPNAGEPGSGNETEQHSSANARVTNPEKLASNPVARK